MLDNKLASLIQDIYNQTSKGCGLSYELFSERFSNMLDHHIDTLDEPERSWFIERAIELGYVLPNERIDVNEQGVCVHYFDANCCPLGCGDL